MSVGVASANERELISATSEPTDSATVSVSLTAVKEPVFSQPKSQGKSRAVAKPKTTTKKSKASTKRKAVTPKVLPAGAHPVYNEMVKEAIAALNERKGSSKVAILKYILQHYNVGDNVPSIGAHVRQALKRGVEKEQLEQTKGVGANGSFRINKAIKISKTVKKTLTPKKKPLAKRSISSVKKSPAKKAAKSKSVKSAPVRKTKSSVSLSTTSKSASATKSKSLKKVAKKAVASKKSPKKAVASKKAPVKKTAASKKSPKKAAASKMLPVSKSLKIVSASSKQIKKSARK